MFFKSDLKMTITPVSVGFRSSVRAPERIFVVQIERVNIAPIVMALFFFFFFFF